MKLYPVSCLPFFRDNDFSKSTFAPHKEADILKQVVLEIFSLRYCDTQTDDALVQFSHNFGTFFTYMGAFCDANCAAHGKYFKLPNKRTLYVH